MIIMARLNMNGLLKVTRGDLREYSDKKVAMKYRDIEDIVYSNITGGDIQIFSERCWRPYNKYEYDLTMSITVCNNKAMNSLDTEIYNLELLKAKDNTDMYYIVSAKHKQKDIFNNTESYKELKEGLLAAHIEANKTDEERLMEIEIEECAEALNELCSYVEDGAIVHIGHILSWFSDEYNSVYAEINKTKCYLDICIKRKANNKALCDMRFYCIDDEYELYEGEEVTCYAYQYEDKYNAVNKY
jgi:hypothetical protein